MFPWLQALSESTLLNNISCIRFQRVPLDSIKPSSGDPLGCWVTLTSFSGTATICASTTDYFGTVGSLLWGVLFRFIPLYFNPYKERGVIVVLAVL